MDIDQNKYDVARSAKALFFFRAGTHFVICLESRRPCLNSKDRRSILALYALHR